MPLAKLLSKKKAAIVLLQARGGGVQLILEIDAALRVYGRTINPEQVFTIGWRGRKLYKLHQERQMR